VFNNTMHGFLRLTVDAKSILCESLGVDETTKATSSMDAFTVDLTKHVVATQGAAQASRTRAGDVVRPRTARTATPAAKAGKGAKAKKRK